MEDNMRLCGLSSGYDTSTADYVNNNCNDLVNNDMEYNDRQIMNVADHVIKGSGEIIHAVVMNQCFGKNNLDRENNVVDSATVTQELSTLSQALTKAQQIVQGRAEWGVGYFDEELKEQSAKIQDLSAKLLTCQSSLDSTRFMFTLLHANVAAFNQ